MITGINRKKVNDFLSKEIWQIQLHELSRIQSFLVRIVRVVYLSIRGFDEDSCFLRASALTFYTLMSLVPLAAMIFGIAKGFGMKRILEERLIEYFAAHEEIVRSVIAYSDSLLQTTRGGFLAGIGVIILFWSVIKVLGTIEYSFNAVWGVKTGRTLTRKFSDYLAMMLFLPVILIMSGSVTVLLGSQITALSEKIALFALIGPFVLYSLKLIPYFLVCGLFTFMYKFLPNTRVNLLPALVAGILAGTMYQLVQLGFFMVEVSLTRYSVIYGSFAVLPLFLVWLQISWIIVLFGAELSFAHQNVETYEFESEALNISDHARKSLALLIAHEAVKRFAAGEKPADENEITSLLGIPSRLVRRVLFELVDAGILTRISTDGEQETAFQPAFDINRMTVQTVIDLLDLQGVDTISSYTNQEIKELESLLMDLAECSRRSPANKRLVDI